MRSGALELPAFDLSSSSGDVTRDRMGSASRQLTADWDHLGVELSSEGNRRVLSDPGQNAQEQVPKWGERIAKAASVPFDDGSKVAFNAVRRGIAAALALA